jgi:hypothetical protein
VITSASWAKVRKQRPLAFELWRRWNTQLKPGFLRHIRGRWHELGKAGFTLRRDQLALRRPQSTFSGTAGR